MPGEYQLSDKEEKAEYDKHENNPDDLGYRQFLGRMFEPMNLRIQSESNGMDFGCGPGPTLSVMFEEVGHRVSLYDKFYFADRSVLEDSFDFITATEVVEHLAEPMKWLDKLWNSLEPNGYLGVMTKLVESQEKFQNWHYKNDPTHISFFSNETFEWLAGYWQANHNSPVSFELIGKDVVIFHKPLA